MRVGDAGYRYRKRHRVTARLSWCDMERVSTERGELVARCRSSRSAFRSLQYRTAVVWILSEGTKRVPAAYGRNASLASLPEPKDNDEDFVVIEGLQIAGRHCAASGKPISFERDARLCPVCGQVYPKDETLKKCLTCDVQSWLESGRSLTVFRAQRGAMRVARRARALTSFARHDILSGSSSRLFRVISCLSCC